jgi:xanthine dehydrogenase iron-sulfur cluster and FAD-binding subunit A
MDLGKGDAGRRDPVLSEKVPGNRTNLVPFQEAVGDRAVQLVANVSPDFLGACLGSGEEDRQEEGSENRSALHGNLPRKKGTGWRNMARATRVGARQRSSDPGKVTDEELKEPGLSSRQVQELKDKLKPRLVPDLELDLGRMVSAEAVEKRMYEAVPLSSE